MENTKFGWITEMNKKSLDACRLVAMIFFVCIAGCAHQQSDNGSDVEAINTFRGVVWGSRFEDADNLISDKQSGNTIYARNKKEVLMLGDASIESVTYFFIDKIFERAEIKYKGLENFALIKSELIHQLGEPKHNDISTNIFIWAAKNRPFGVTLRYYRTGHGTIIYCYAKKG